MSRPTIPIEPYIEKLVQALLLGASYELAAQFAGIAPKTFQRGRQRAATARPGTPLARLRDRLSDAEGRAAIGWLAKIEVAATNGDWRAAAWKLERRYPEAFGRHAKVDVQADLTLQIQQAAQEVADELGLDPADILAEAQQFLREHDQGRRHP